MKYFRCLGVSLGLVAQGALAQPFGIDARAPNTTLQIDELPHAEPNGFPARLSDQAALLSAGLGHDQTDAGILPYRPSSELWSDNALKSRFIAVPGLETVGYRGDAGWDFPEGTVLIKNFSLPLDFRDPENTAQRIETRLMVRNGGAWHGFSYEWNEAETDAELLPAGKERDFILIDEDGNSFDYTWQYPNRIDCFDCHTAAANHVLGLNTTQMNHDFQYPGSGVTDNQLRALAHIGLFNEALPAAPDALPSSPDAFLDLDASVADRAQSYLQANCAMCHRPGGPTSLTLDLRWGVPLESRQIVDVPVTNANLGIASAVRFAPGDPDRSILLQRMAHPSHRRMPPLATTIVHDDALTLMRQWILAEGRTPVEGEGEAQHARPHSADIDHDFEFSLSEVLRVVQLYNALTHHCDLLGEDGYRTGPGDFACTPHDSDYAPADWRVALSELLRLIQFYNTGGYIACTESEDGFCPTE